MTGITKETMADVTDRVKLEKRLEELKEQYAKDVLEKYGYNVITAENGEDAVEKYTTYSNSMDLLVLDVIMPKKNGKEAYDEIRRQRPDMKALFMSGYTGRTMPFQ